MGQSTYRYTMEWGLYIGLALSFFSIGGLCKHQHAKNPYQNRLANQALALSALEKTRAPFELKLRDKRIAEDGLRYKEKEIEARLAAFEEAEFALREKKTLIAAKETTLINALNTWKHALCIAK